MNPLLVELQGEHEKILEMIKQRQIPPLLDYVENVHHAKEERLLFPTLAKHPLLRQGGPRCSYFMGLVLDLRAYAPARKLLGEFYSKGGPRASEYKDFEWLKENNPLRIPMEEHILGHELASAIRHQTNTPSTEITLDRFYEEYCRLLTLHIEKEDTCLFLIADRILALESTP